MTKPRLTYFDFSGRGEDARLAYFIAGVDFEDNRIKGAAWRELKPSTPFGGLPTLEIEGKGVLAQSNAILTYIGREHGLHPQDNWEAARHEALMAAVEELRGAISRTLGLSPDEKRRVREELAAGEMQTWGANVERQLGDGPFVAGEALSVVDLKLFVLLNWFVSGTLDHVPADVFRGFPRLMGVFEAVRRHPRVVAWYAR
ncbi:MAG: glutathione S-transferase family protein [Myxococcales bacterium]|nr:glutathione S-transferase family protein [Myxococcales bacterium]MCB9748600.1 glutathione S-transferase family protein [Myxococcales bacterium]